MRVFITGSDGFTGSHFCVTACEEGHQVLGTDVTNHFMPEGCRIETLDIRDEQACKALCRAFKPEAIIHTARAPGSLWQTEKDRLNTYQINVLGTKTLGRCAENLDATFIFLSTDWVFSGSKPRGQKYVEEDDGGPLNYYGVTKWIAEQEVRNLKTKWLILRPSHIYGFNAAVLTPETKERSGLLARSVWAGIGQAIQKGMKIRVPDDMFQTPVYVNHLVETTLALLKKGVEGTYHLVDRDCTSRYQIAKTVLASIGLDDECIEKGVAEDFAQSQGLPPELGGALPLNTCLDVNRIERELGHRMLTFEEGVSRMKLELNQSWFNA
jgi:dTDP-4-dehydrorhamnose reductase